MVMKFRATEWNKELEFEPFKKINIFVGEDVVAIEQLFDQAANNNSIVTYMEFGSKWYHRNIEILMSVILEAVVEHNSTILAYVNSLEVIEMFPKVIKKFNLENDFQLIRIGKSVKTSTKDVQTATYISYDVLCAMIEMGLEMR